MASEFIDRCPTGIIGFDALCQGGFVRNSDNLILGGPGSGKSTFLLQFLWNGITQYNENGLYCSFEPDILEILEDAKVHGWDFTRASEQGQMKFMRFSPETSLDELKNELKKVVSRYNIRRICFDPVSLFALSKADKGKMRQTIFDLSSMMKRMRVTTLYADEIIEAEGVMGSSDGEWGRTDILRFLSDSVVVLYEAGLAGIGDRAIRISKMRRTAHDRKVAGMAITQQGVVVYSSGSTSQFNPLPRKL
jgi:KaiC/GvpD/RAD55 family RecA-like ATPase